MKQIMAVIAVCGLLVLPAFALSESVQSAIKTFEATGADDAKMKTYCEMNTLMATAGEEEDEAKAEELDKKVQALVKELGPEMESAFEAGGDLDPDSEDGKAYDAAIEALDAKCS